MISYTDLTTAVQALIQTGQPTEIAKLQWRNDDFLDHSVTVTLYPESDTGPNIQVMYTTPEEERTATHGIKQRDCQQIAKQIKEFYNQEVKPYQ